MTAPGNAVRAGMIGYSCPPAKAVARSLYEGTHSDGRLCALPPAGADGAGLAPSVAGGEGKSYSFRHPFLLILLSAGLFCAQLTPPIYSIASIGDGRIQDTYWLCFVVLWLLWVYLLLGFAARKWPDANAGGA